MRIAIFGGSFNPPHLGHREVAKNVSEKLDPDLFLIIPDNIPPHKEMDDGSPSAKERFELCTLNFNDIKNVKVSDIEINRDGKSYTADTIKLLREIYPDDEFYFVMGTDMLLSFEEWYQYKYLLEQMNLVVLSRNSNDSSDILSAANCLRDKYDAKINFIDEEPSPMSSSEIRSMLKLRTGSSYLKDEVYSQIVKNRLYNAQVELYWLREKVYELLNPNRVAHVAGVETEAFQLAKVWGEDPEKAAEAGILHDITKKLKYEEQLILFDKYGIIKSDAILNNPKLLHPITGAELSKDLFGVCSDVYNAILWHTTGKPDMTLLEKIIYLADYIEPNRDFPGVDNLRKLAYENIDEAMRTGLEMSIEDIKSRGEEPYHITIEAFEWYNRKE